MTFAVIDESKPDGEETTIRTFEGSPSFTIKGNELKVISNGKTINFGGKASFITILMDGRVIARSFNRGDKILIQRH